MIVDGTLTSVWDGGYKLTTECKVNMETKEVFDIEVVENGIEDYLDVLDCEYITIDGKDYRVYPKYECTDTQTEFWYE